MWFQSLFSRWVQEINACNFCIQQARDIVVIVRTGQDHLRTSGGAVGTGEHHAGLHGRQCQVKGSRSPAASPLLRGSLPRTHRAAQVDNLEVDPTSQQSGLRDFGAAAQKLSYRVVENFGYVQPIGVRSSCVAASLLMSTTSETTPVQTMVSCEITSRPLTA